MFKMSVADPKITESSFPPSQARVMNVFYHLPTVLAAGPIYKLNPVYLSTQLNGTKLDKRLRFYVKFVTKSYSSSSLYND